MAAIRFSSASRERRLSSPAKGSGIGVLGERGEAGDIAFDAASVDHGGAKHGERDAAFGDQPLGFELGAAIGIGGLRRVLSR